MTPFYSLPRLFSPLTATIALMGRYFAAALAALAAVALVTLVIVSPADSPRNDFRFSILGDRTGDAQPGVYERIWTELDGEHPDFVINVGDTIQGGNDATAAAEWRALRPHRDSSTKNKPGTRRFMASTTKTPTSACSTIANPQTSAEI